MLQEDQLLFLNNESYNRVINDDKVIVHISPEGSVPMVLKTKNTPGTGSEVLMVQCDATSLDLRNEIFKITGNPANSIDLTINETIVQEPFSLSNFSAGSKIIFKVRNKLKLNVNLSGCKGAQHASLSVCHLDTTLNLKCQIAYKCEVPPHVIEVYFDGKQLQDSWLLNTYRLCDNDTVNALVHEIRISVHIRQTGRTNERIHLLVDDCSTYTVCKLKTYLAKTYQRNPQAFNVIYESACLEDKCSFRDVGIKSEATLIVKVSSEFIETLHGGVITVYMTSDQGVTELTLAIPVNGILFRAPDGLDISLLKDKLCVDTSEVPCFMSDCKELSSAEESPIHQVSEVPTETTEIESTKGLKHKCVFPTPEPSKSQYCRKLSIRHSSKVLKQSHSEPTLTKDMCLPGKDNSIASTSCSNQNDSSTVCGDGPYDSVNNERFTLSSSVQKQKIYAKGKSLFRKESTSSTMLISQQDAWTAMSTCMDEKLEQRISQQLIQNNGAFSYPPDVVNDYVLLQVAKELGWKWKEVCIFLGVPWADLEKLEFDRSQDLPFHALRHWKMRCGAEANINRLKEALQRADLNLLADSLNEWQDKKYQTS